MKRSSSKPNTQTTLKFQGVKKVAVPVPRQTKQIMTEESKTASDHHYCTVGLVDYKQLLDQKGFEFSGEQCKLKIKGAPDEPFPKMSQCEFEEIGELVQGWVRQTMRESFGMKELWIGGSENGPKCNIYVSDDFETNKDRCLILIQGTGAVRAGVWARSVCVNDNLSLGSMFPML